ncbi:hypothetical protein [Suttonella indologenes]|uniref:Sulfur oxidation protein SoxY n=2 Tax=Pseudomonadota TaxID=1224 RepID=A0A380MMC2_9GAMM|nr:hypothetical protein [Suttonella indologenes]SUO91847.1 sulfur oxidation protein SoxY [Suttonella indologenes]
MATITVSIQQGNNTLNSHRLATENTEALRIQAQKNVNYLLTDESTGFAPENLTATRHGKDLHIAFEGSQEADLIIENYYEDGNNNLLIGLHENGQYYAYIPESANNLDIVTQLAEQVSAGQALGGEALSAAVFNSAFNPAWLFLPLAIGGIAAAAGGGSSSNNGGGSNNNNNSVIASPDIEPSTNNAENKFDGGASVIPSANAGTLNISYLDHNGKKIEIKATKSDHDNDPSTPAIWTATDQNGKTLPNAQDPNSPWIDPTSGKVTLPPNSVPNGETVSAEQSIDGKNSSPATEKITDQIPPNALHISVDQDSGKVSIDPNTDPSTTQTSITYINDQGEETTVITAKGDHDNNPNTPDTWAVVDENGEEISNSDVEIDSRTGTITIAGEKIKAESKIEAKASDGLNISQPATAYEPAAPQPRITANIDGSATVDALKNVKDSTLEISGTYAQPQAGIDTFKFTLNWDGIKWAAQNTSDPITVGTDPADGKPIVTVNAGVAKDGSQITAIQKVPGLGQGKHEVTMRDQIPEPQVIDNSDGSVSITPKTSKIAEPTEVTITYTDESGAEKTVTVSKDPNNNKWTSSNPNITANPITGAVTLPESSVQDGSTVSAKQKVTLTDPNTQKQTSVVSSDETVIAGNAIPNPEIIANNDGSVSIKPSDTAKQTTINYTDENGKEQEKTFTKEDTNGDGRPDTWKDNDPNDKVSIDPMTGEITIPADEVKDDSTATATQTLLNDTQGTGQTTAKAQNGDSSTTVKPDIKAGPDGSAIVTLHPDAEKSTITYTDEKGKGKIVTVSKDPKTNEWTSSDPKVSIDASGEKPVITVAGTDIKDGSTVTATQSTAAGASAPVSVKVADNTPEPTIKAKENGSVSVTPSKKATEVNIRYTDESGAEKTATVSKDLNTNEWTSNNPSVSVDKDKGTVSIPADKVKDGSEVTANQTVDGQKSNDATDRAKENDTADKPSKPGDSNGDGVVNEQDDSPKTTDIPVKQADGTTQPEPTAKNTDGKPNIVFVDDADKNGTLSDAEIGTDNKVQAAITIPDKTQAGDKIAVSINGAAKEVTLTDADIQTGHIVVDVPTVDENGKKLAEVSVKAKAVTADGKHESGEGEEKASVAATKPGDSNGDGVVNEQDDSPKTTDIPVKQADGTTQPEPTAKNTDGKPNIVFVDDADKNGTLSDAEIGTDNKVQAAITIPDKTQAGDKIAVSINGGAVKEVTLTDADIQTGHIVVDVPTVDENGKKLAEISVKAKAVTADGKHESGEGEEKASVAATKPGDSNGDGVVNEQDDSPKTTDIPVKQADGTTQPEPTAKNTDGKPNIVFVDDADKNGTLSDAEIGTDNKVQAAITIPDKTQAGDKIAVSINGAAKEVTLTDADIQTGHIVVDVPTVDENGKKLAEISVKAKAVTADGKHESGEGEEKASVAATKPGDSNGDGVVNEQDDSPKTTDIPVKQADGTTQPEPTAKNTDGKPNIVFVDDADKNGKLSDAEIGTDNKVQAAITIPDKTQAGDKIAVSINGGAVKEVTLTDADIQTGHIVVDVPTVDENGKKLAEISVKAKAVTADGKHESGEGEEKASVAATKPGDSNGDGVVNEQDDSPKTTDIPVKQADGTTQPEPTAKNTDGKPNIVFVDDADKNGTLSDAEIGTDNKVQAAITIPDKTQAGDKIAVSINGAAKEVTLTDADIQTGHIVVDVPTVDENGKKLAEISVKAKAVTADGKHESGEGEEKASVAATKPGDSNGDGVVNEQDDSPKTTDIPVKQADGTTQPEPTAKNTDGKPNIVFVDDADKNGKLSDAEIGTDNKVQAAITIPDKTQAGDKIAVSINGGAVKEVTLTDADIQTGHIVVDVPTVDENGKKLAEISVKAKAVTADGKHESGEGEEKASVAATKPGDSNGDGVVNEQDDSPKTTDIPVKQADGTTQPEPTAKNTDGKPNIVFVDDADKNGILNDAEIGTDNKVQAAITIPDKTQAGDKIAVSINGGAVKEVTLTDADIQTGHIVVDVPTVDENGKKLAEISVKAKAVTADGKHESGEGEEKASVAATKPGDSNGDGVVNEQDDSPKTTDIPVKQADGTTQPEPTAKNTDGKPNIVFVDDADKNGTLSDAEIGTDNKVQAAITIPDKTQAGDKIAVSINGAAKEVTLTDADIQTGHIVVDVPTVDENGKKLAEVSVKAKAVTADGKHESGEGEEKASVAATKPGDSNGDGVVNEQDDSPKTTDIPVKQADGTTQPEPTAKNTDGKPNIVFVDDADKNGTLSDAEIGTDNKVQAAITIPDKTQAGDKIAVSINGGAVKEVTLTDADIQTGHIVVDVPTVDENGKKLAEISVKAKAVTADGKHESGEGEEKASVAATKPGDSNGDGVVNEQDDSPKTTDIPVKQADGTTQPEPTAKNTDGKPNIVFVDDADKNGTLSDAEIGTDNKVQAAITIPDKTQAGDKIAVSINGAAKEVTLTDADIQTGHIVVDVPTVDENGKKLAEISVKAKAVTADGKHESGEGEEKASVAATKPGDSNGDGVVNEQDDSPKTTDIPVKQADGTTQPEPTAKNTDGKPNIVFVDDADKNGKLSDAEIGTDNKVQAAITIPDKTQAGDKIAVSINGGAVKEVTLTDADIQTGHIVVDVPTVDENGKKLAEISVKAKAVTADGKHESGEGEEKASVAATKPGDSNGDGVVNEQDDSPKTTDIPVKQADGTTQPEPTAKNTDGKPNIVFVDDADKNGTLSDAEIGTDNKVQAAITIPDKTQAGDKIAVSINGAAKEVTLTDADIQTGHIVVDVPTVDENGKKLAEISVKAKAVTADGKHESGEGEEKASVAATKPGDSNGDGVVNEQDDSPKTTDIPVKQADGTTQPEPTAKNTDGKPNIVFVDDADKNGTLSDAEIGTDNKVQAAITIPDKTQAGDKIAVSINGAAKEVTLTDADIQTGHIVVDVPTVDENGKKLAEISVKAKAVTADGKHESGEGEEKASVAATKPGDSNGDGVVNEQDDSPKTTDIPVKQADGTTQPEPTAKNTDGKPNIVFVDDADKNGKLSDAEIGTDNKVQAAITIPDKTQAGDKIAVSINGGAVKEVTLTDADIQTGHIVVDVPTVDENGKKLAEISVKAKAVTADGKHESGEGEEKASVAATKPGDSNGDGVVNEQDDSPKTTDIPVKQADGTTQPEPTAKNTDGKPNIVFVDDADKNGTLSDAEIGTDNKVQAAITIPDKTQAGDKIAVSINGGAVKEVTLTDADIQTGHIVVDVPTVDENGKKLAEISVKAKAVTADGKHESGEGEEKASVAATKPGDSNGDGVVNEQDDSPKTTDIPVKQADGTTQPEPTAKNTDGKPNIVFVDDADKNGTLSDAEIGTDNKVQAAITIPDKTQAGDKIAVSINGAAKEVTLTDADIQTGHIVVDVPTVDENGKKLAEVSVKAKAVTADGKHESGEGEEKASVAATKPGDSNGDGVVNEQDDSPKTTDIPVKQADGTTQPEPTAKNTDGKPNIVFVDDADKNGTLSDAEIGTDNKVQAAITIPDKTQAGDKIAVSINGGAVKEVTLTDADIQTGHIVVDVPTVDENGKKLAEISVKAKAVTADGKHESGEGEEKASVAATKPGDSNGDGVVNEQDDSPKTTDIPVKQADGTTQPEPTAKNTDGKPNIVFVDDADKNGTLSDAEIGTDNKVQAAITIPDKTQAGDKIAVSINGAAKEVTLTDADIQTGHIVVDVPTVDENGKKLAEISVKAKAVTADGKHESGEGEEKASVAATKPGDSNGDGVVNEQDDSPKTTDIPVKQADGTTQPEPTAKNTDGKPNIVFVDDADKNGKLSDAEIGTDNKVQAAITIPDKTQAGDKIAVSINGGAVKEVTLTDADIQTGHIVVDVPTVDENGKKLAEISVKAKAVTADGKHESGEGEEKASVAATKPGDSNGDGVVNEQDDSPKTTDIPVKQADGTTQPEPTAKNTDGKPNIVFVDDADKNGTLSDAEIGTDNKVQAAITIPDKTQAGDKIAVSINGAAKEVTLTDADIQTGHIVVDVPTVDENGKKLAEVSVKAKAVTADGKHESGEGEEKASVAATKPGDSNGDGVVNEQDDSPKTTDIPVKQADGTTQPEPTAKNTDGKPNIVFVDDADKNGTLSDAEIGTDNKVQAAITIPDKTQAGDKIAVSINGAAKEVTLTDADIQTGHIVVDVPTVDENGKKLAEISVKAKAVTADGKHESGEGEEKASVAATKPGDSNGDGVVNEQDDSPKTTDIPVKQADGTTQPEPTAKNTDGKPNIVFVDDADKNGKLSDAEIGTDNKVQAAITIPDKTQAGDKIAVSINGGAVKEVTLTDADIQTGHIVVDVPTVDENGKKLAEISVKAKAVTADGKHESGEGEEKASVAATKPGDSNGDGVVNEQDDSPKTTDIPVKQADGTTQPEPTAKNTDGKPNIVFVDDADKNGTLSDAEIGTDNKVQAAITIPDKTQAGDKIAVSINGGAVKEVTLTDADIQTGHIVVDVPTVDENGKKLAEISVKAKAVTADGKHESGEGEEKASVAATKPGDSNGDGVVNEQDDSPKTTDIPVKQADGTTQPEPTAKNTDGKPNIVFVDDADKNGTLSDAEIGTDNKVQAAITIPDKTQAGDKIAVSINGAAKEVTLTDADIQTGHIVVDVPTVDENGKKLAEVSVKAKAVTADGKHESGEGEEKASVAATKPGDSNGDGVVNEQDDSPKTTDIPVKQADGTTQPEPTAKNTDGKPNIVFVDDADKNGILNDAEIGTDKKVQAAITIPDKTQAGDKIAVSINGGAVKEVTLTDADIQTGHIVVDVPTVDENGKKLAEISVKAKAVTADGKRESGEGEKTAALMGKLTVSIEGKDNLTDEDSSKLPTNYDKDKFIGKVNNSKGLNYENLTTGLTNDSNIKFTVTLQREMTDKEKVTIVRQTVVRDKDGNIISVGKEEEIKSLTNKDKFVFDATDNKFKFNFEDSMLKGIETYGTEYRYTAKVKDGNTLISDPSVLNLKLDTIVEAFNMISASNNRTGYIFEGKTEKGSKIHLTYEDTNGVTKTLDATVGDEGQFNFTIPNDWKRNSKNAVLTITDAAGNVSQTNLSYIKRLYVDMNTENALSFVTQNNPIGSQRTSTDKNQAHIMSDDNDWVFIGGTIGTQWKAPNIDMSGGDDYLFVDGNITSGPKIDMGSGNDKLEVKGGFAAGFYSIKLGNGNDILDIATNIDNSVTADIDAGAGNDIFRIGGNWDGKGTVDFGAGDDIATIGGYIAGAKTIDFGEGNDVLIVNGKAPAIIPGTPSIYGNNTITMGAGNDTVVVKGKITATKLDAGDGYDILRFSDEGVEQNLSNIVNFELIDLTGSQKGANRLNISIDDVLKNGDTVTEIDGVSYKGLFINGTSSDTVDLGNNGDRGLGGFEKTTENVPNGYKAYWDGSNKESLIFIQNDINII